MSDATTADGAGKTSPRLVNITCSAGTEKPVTMRDTQTGVIEYGDDTRLVADEMFRTACRQADRLKVCRNLTFVRAFLESNGINYEVIGPERAAHEGAHKEGGRLLEQTATMLGRLKRRPRTRNDGSSGNEPNRCGHTHLKADEPGSLKALIDEWTQGHKRPAWLHIGTGYDPATSVAGLEAFIVERMAAKAQPEPVWDVEKERSATLLEVAAAGLGTSVEWTRRLCQGPNDFGRARAWISPAHAAAACRVAATAAQAQRAIEPAAIWEATREIREEAIKAADELAIAALQKQHLEAAAHETATKNGTEYAAEYRKAAAALEDAYNRDRIDPTATIDPRATIAPGVRIGAGTTIGPWTLVEEGTRISHDVAIGADCYIGPRAIINNLTRIGNATAIKKKVRIGPAIEIGQGVVVHSGTIILRFTTIEEGAEIGPGCDIGPQCRIGAHARINGPATLGSRTTVKDHGLVNPGTTTGEDTTIGPSPPGKWRQTHP